jgi:hypothetical protein
MPRTGRPKLGEKAKAVPLSLRLTERQHELLAMIARKLTAMGRETSPYAPAITNVEAVRMMIMMTAQEWGFIELNDEPAESFDLRPKKKKPKK